MLSTKKIAALTLAAVAGAAIIVTQTASSKGQAYKLEGAWTYNEIQAPGMLSTMTLAPSDPSGRAGIFRISVPSGSPALAPLLAYYGADAVADYIGEVRMLSRNVAESSWVGYFIKTGLPSEIKVSRPAGFGGRDGKPHHMKTAAESP